MRRLKSSAQYFNIPITNIIGDYYKNEEPNATKEALLQNSGFLNGMVMKKAADVVIDKLEEMNLQYPEVSAKEKSALEDLKIKLESEK